MGNLSRNGVFVAALAVIAVSAAACGGGGGGKPTPSPTELPLTATSTAGATQPAPTASAPNEKGQAPIFWRTADNFAGVHAGEAYKVVFRIEGGYAEPSLTVSAACQTCPTAAQRAPINFEGQKVQPVGEDAPGSYYPVNITVPTGGTWEITVVAGSDRAQFTFEAAGASTG